MESSGGFMAKIRNVAVLVAVIAGAASCGQKKKSGSTATAKLAMSNSTTSLNLMAAVPCPSGSGYNSNTNCYTPSYYGIKMLNAIVSPDQSGATSGPAGLVWANPACPATSTKSEINGKEYTYDSMDQSCDDSKVTTYFDFGRTTEAVNADLNSQSHSILPGTYNYVQLAFCIGGAKSQNFSFKAEGMTENGYATQDSCGIASAKADPAIVVGEGENVTISLAYDLKGVIVDTTSGGGTADTKTCYSSGGVTRCIGPSIALTPSFTKN
jgi:hypothetical protein